mmetsp:Transcript_46235/g.128856  ORF Transcript_46235/g.128856 Transcript_46235/m.128856 type:complete len:210 (-) Transcript_46235:108-737(-)
MGFIPHPEIPLGSLRPHDMLVLLVAGAVWEVLLRAILWSHKRKPTAIRLRELKFKELDRRVRKSRALGPPAFVETSKLERQQLAEEKALAELAEARKADLAAWQKLSRNLNLVVCGLIAFVYYGIPLLEFSPHHVTPRAGEVLTVEEAGVIAEAMMQAFLFPLSIFGMGIRVSKWGLPNPKSSVGALLVFWSAQTTVGKIIDGIEALSM